MRAYSDGMPGATAVVLVNWTILGMVMFIPFMLRPMEYYGKTTTTIEIMLEEKSILGQSEMQISYILDRIIMKLERVDYAKYILVPIKSSIFSVKALLFIIMFGIDIFAAYWKKIH
uniref:Uncharacterized protein n=1 Tax=Acrobeloides nanus TaxID=290746 RepID=A0A914DJT9_9BILA